MKASQERSLRISILIIGLVAIGIILPQVSTNAAKGVQEKEITPIQQEGSKAPPAYPELSVLPVSSPVKSPSQPAIPNAPTMVEQSEVEPNGTSATATPLSGTSVKVTGSINPNGDQDFYSFSATAGDRIYAAVQSAFSASASTDSILELVDTNGTTIIEGDEDDGSFGSLSSSIANAPILSTGTFFIKVRHNSATVQLRPYFMYFQLRSGSATPETEPNDVFPGQALPASGWASGSTSSAADADFYSIALNAGDTIYMGLDMDPERNGDANMQLGLGAFNAFILLVNDSGAGFAPYTAPDSEAHFMTVKAAGTYGILVSVATSPVGVAGTYTLSVSVLPAANRGINCTTYTSTNVPVTIADLALASSTLTVPGNPRIEHMQVSIQATHTFFGDLDFDLVSPSGNVVGLFNDVFNSSVGGPSVMDVTIDDYAAIPPAFAVAAGMIHQPELNYRLDWFKGQSAGGTWTLRIRDDAGGDTGTLTGWSIRICEPTPPCGGGGTTTVFGTDFESGAAGFTHSGTLDEWELGLPATAATTTTNPVAAFTTANSGVNAWKTDLDNTYDASSTQDLLSPNISLAAVSGQIQLNWAQKFQMDTATNDHAFVEVRQVGVPLNAKRVWEWDGAVMTLAVGSPVVNIGEAAGWGLYHADISSFAGLNVEVRFHLDSGTGTTNFGGLAIDDVSVTACAVVAVCDITCPANITQPNDPNQCGAVVTYPAPTSSGSCGTINCSPASGSFFPVGTTTVTCLADVGQGNAPGGNGNTQCTFTITVEDTQDPSITCPANITQSNDPNQCGAVVNYPPPTITDNCPGMFTATCNPPSGSFFPVGTTTVTCTVDGTNEMKVTPAKVVVPATKTSSAGKVGATTSKGGINVGAKPTTSNSGSGSPKGPAPTLPASPFAVLYDQTNNPAPVPGGVTSQNFEAANDAFDTEAADDFVVPAGVTWTIQQVFVIGEYSNAATATSANVVIYSDTATLPGALVYSATSAPIADVAGDLTITLTVPAVLSPGTYWVSVQANENFTGGGQWFWDNRSTTSNSGAAWRNPGAGFGVGCTAFGRKTTCLPTQNGPDELFQLLGTSAPIGGGGGPTCTFTITVNDTQPPTITCPPNQTAVTPTVSDPCTVVNFTTTASDNCPGVIVVCNPPSGSCFPVGVTTVTCTATDASGNTATCTFTVSVFNGRLQDDFEACNDTVLFNTITGDYRWCCHGTIFTGRGKITRAGDTIRLEHVAADRRVRIDLSDGRFPPTGNGSIQSPPGTVRCVLQDRDTRDDFCVCGAPAPQ